MAWLVVGKQRKEKAMGGCYNECLHVLLLRVHVRQFKEAKCTVRPRCLAIRETFRRQIPAQQRADNDDISSNPLGYSRIDSHS